MWNENLLPRVGLRDLGAPCVGSKSSDILRRFGAKDGSVTSKVVLVGHTVGETDDRAAAWLAGQGYEIDWYTPCDGDVLPRSTENVLATVVYGGVYDVHQQSEHQFLRDELNWLERCFKDDIPTLGLCLGAQLMANVLGVPVTKHPGGQVEYGYHPLARSTDGEAVFPEQLMVLEAHWEGWFDLPAGATHLASTEHFPQQSFRYGESAYAFQFHPEAHYAMLERWVSRRSPERATRPGAHPVERQLEDCRRYDTAVNEWFSGFLTTWSQSFPGAR